jgi:hypothetical protein
MVSDSACGAPADRDSIATPNPTPTKSHPYKRVYQPLM